MNEIWHHLPNLGLFVTLPLPIISGLLSSSVSLPGALAGPMTLAQGVGGAREECFWRCGDGSSVASVSRIAVEAAWT